MTFERDKWPFTPICLRDLIDEPTLSVLQAGCCERLGRPLVLFDRDPNGGGFVQRIESLNLRKRFEAFCTTVRQEIPGGEEACLQCNLQMANTSVDEFIRTRDPYRVFHCHLGLGEATYVLQILGRPVAVLYSGQYLPPAGPAVLLDAIRSLGTGRFTDLRPSPAVREKLLAQVYDLAPAPAELRDQLKQEAEHIEQVAAAEYRQKKYHGEQELLDRLRESVDYDESPGLTSVRRLVAALLTQIVEFCGCEYAVFFASVQKGETVLPALAAVGLPEAIQDNLPHFNWKKADLPLERFDNRRWNTLEWYERARHRAIRGDNSEAFASAELVIPTSLSDRFRGTLAFGPFEALVDLEHEYRFLLAVTEAIGSVALIQLEVRDLDLAHRRWESTARLIIHQLSTALTPITTQIGRARFYAKRLDDGADKHRIADLLQRSEDLSIRLRQSARRTIDSHVMLLEPDDFKFERYPLSVLVANCIEGYAAEADKKQRELILDESIECLPEADVDVARLTIALSNLLHNALKYSFPFTKIYVRSRVEAVDHPDETVAILEVDDIGDEIRQDERERIFEEGTRGLTQAKMGRIPGTGLGLWEARAVVEAHDGMIGVTCERTQIRRRQGIAHRVVFTVRIPLKRKV